MIVYYLAHLVYRQRDMLLHDSLNDKRWEIKCQRYWVSVHLPIYFIRKVDGSKLSLIVCQAAKAQQSQITSRHTGWIENRIVADHTRSCKYQKSCGPCYRVLLCKREPSSIREKQPDFECPVWQDIDKGVKETLGVFLVMFFVHHTYHCVRLSHRRSKATNAGEMVTSRYPEPFAIARSTRGRVSKRFVVDSCCRCTELSRAMMWVMFLHGRAWASGSAARISLSAIGSTQTLLDSSSQFISSCKVGKKNKLAK